MVSLSQVGLMIRPSKSGRCGLVPASQPCVDTQSICGVSASTQTAWRLCPAIVTSLSRSGMQTLMIASLPWAGTYALSWVCPSAPTALNLLFTAGISLSRSGTQTLTSDSRLWGATPRKTQSASATMMQGKMKKSKRPILTAYWTLILTLWEPMSCYMETQVNHAYQLHWWWNHQSVGYTNWRSKAATHCWKDNPECMCKYAAEEYKHEYDSEANPKCPVTGHTGLVVSVASSPNCKYVASVSKEKTILIWDTKT